MLTPCDIILLRSHRSHPRRHSPVVLAHRQSLVDYRAVRPHLKKILTEQRGAPLAAATLVYYYHAKYRYWFKQQWDVNTPHWVDAPRFSTGFQMFADGYNMSWIPNTNHVPALRRLVRPTVLPTAPQTWTANGNSPARSGGANPSRSAESPASPQRPRVRNHNPDPRLLETGPLVHKLRNMKINELLSKAATPVPQGAAGVRCLTWHAKGGCFSDCLRVQDHTALEGEEKEALYQWCKLALE